jgi:hypothetical protein
MSHHKTETVARSLRFSCALGNKLHGRWRIRTSDLCRVNNWPLSQNTRFPRVFRCSIAAKVFIFELSVNGIVARGGVF